MTFTPKNWIDSPSTSTPLSAAAIEDLETRVTDYADLKAPISVMEYGATGNGVTDDLSSIQAALTAGAGRVVVFPPGNTYRVVGTLTVSAGTTIIGYGATLNIVDNGLAANRSLYINGVTNVTVLGLTITSTAGARTGVYGNIRAEASSRVTIRDCLFLTSPSVAVYVGTCTDVLIEKNQVGNGTLFTYADGIHVNRQSSRVQVVGNVLRATRDDAIGIISNKDGGTYSANQDVLVAHNIINTTVTLGAGISVVGGNGVTLLGNTIRSVVGSGISVVMGGDATYNSGTDAAVIGNRIDTPGATKTCISIGTLNGGLIENNICLNAPGQGIDVLQTSLNLGVTGNRCKGNVYGIYEEAGSGPNVFTSNVLKGNSTGGKLINGGTGSIDANNLT